MENRETQPHTKKAPPATPIRFIAYVSRAHALWALGALLCVTLATTVGSVSPVIFKMIIDGISQSSLPAEQLATLTFWGSVYIGSVGVMFLLWRLSGFLGMQWIVRLEVTANEALYSYVTAHSHGYFTSRFAGAVATKIAHAADGASKFTDHMMWGHYDRALTLLISSGIMLYTDVRIGLIFLALVVGLVLINIPLVAYRRPHVVAYSGSVSALRGTGIDILSNIAAVRQYARREAEHQTIRTALLDVRHKHVTQWKISEWTLLFNNALIVFALGGIMIVMIQMFEQGSITTGDVVLVLTLIFSSSGSLVFIGNAMANIIRLYGEIEEGLDAVLVEYEIKDAADAKELVVDAGEVTWKNVYFKFELNKVFTAFDLTIKPGERVGLVGPSGAGKTTFVSLLLRQHDVESGQILIDGQDIAAVTQDSLRKNIAIVPQEPLLFHRTIRENIAYGKLDASADEIESVARQAQAHDFISALSQGYDTLVGERGVKLSGGQRQRIAIARAMLKDAPILVLDEATSALDSESEVAIQKALHELMEGKTVIAIAHRLSTLREMDRILVLENGQIVEDGTHAELVKGEGLYASLWAHQAGGFLQDGS